MTAAKQYSKKPIRRRQTKRKPDLSFEPGSISATVAAPTTVEQLPSVPLTLRRTTRWPANWWQAFKDRWFPMWLLVHFPVQYEVLNWTETTTIDSSPTR